MGGGDLNQKKSWHPNTFKNQERVWKAEQVEAAEKRKLAELQAEISAERDREDLRRVGQASGIIADNGNKLEWMYRGAKDNLNREDYLLGRAVDKSYEQFAEAERAAEQPNHLGVSAPTNHVEHECVPFSIRAYKDADPTSVQVDMARKIAEDPLMMIKQREMESRKKLLENPVKLKELKQLLQSERGKKSKKDSKKKVKKEKKSKKRKKKRGKSKSSDSESSDSDVDDALLAMLSKQRAVAENDVNMEDLNFDEMIDLKYNTLNKELDKMIKGSSDEEDVDKGLDRKPKGSRADEFNDRRREPERDYYRRQRSVSRARESRRGKSPERRWDRERNRIPLDHHRKEDDRRRDRRGRDRSRSADNRRRDDRPRSRDREGDTKNSPPPPSHKKGSIKQRSPLPKSYTPRKRSESPRKKKTRSHEDKSSPKRGRDDSPHKERRRAVDSDDEDHYKKSAANRNYGLVTASGESIALKNPSQSYTSRKPTQAREQPSKSDTKKPASQSRTKLTEEEKEERLREMMKNAEWRDKERESYVRKYHEDGRKEEDRHRGEEFDRNFIHKELHKSAQSETVESRLKSNRNNIQRSSGVMNTNFARR